MSPVPSLTSISVCAILLYVSTFIVLAILRVATGISIQRVGYFSLNHVAYALRDGVDIWVRKIGVSFHRPSVAHPTWISISIGEVRVTVNLKLLMGEKEHAASLDVAKRKESGKDEKEKQAGKQTSGSSQWRARSKHHHEHSRHTSRSRAARARAVSSTSTIVSGVSESLDESSSSPKETKTQHRHHHHHHHNHSQHRHHHHHDRSQHSRSHRTSRSRTGERPCPPPQAQSKLWKRLTRVRDILHRLHRYVRYLSLIDIHAMDTTICVVDAGEVHIGSLGMRVDTRRKVFEHGKLFRHPHDTPGNARSAEWIVIVRRVILGVEGHESVEVLDNITFNVHGILSTGSTGLSDVGVSAKAGRLHVPYECVESLANRIQEQKSAHKVEEPAVPVWEKFTEGKNEKRKAQQQDEKHRGVPAADESPYPDDPSDSEGDYDVTDLGMDDVVHELDRPGSSGSDQASQIVADSKAFLCSVLGDVKEVQMALSFVRFSRSIGHLNDETKPLYLTVVTHEMGLDIHQIEQSNPAHKMYFQPDDVAHQALLAAMSCSVSLEDSTGLRDRIVYIPMATTTIKTTLPSRAVSFVQNPNVDVRNSNVLFANFVVTSPAIDLEPKHISQISQLLQHQRRWKPNKRQPPTKRKTKLSRRLLASHLLPKASITISIQEPVLRFVIAAKEEEGPIKDQNYHLLVSSVSSISLGIASVHTSERQYSLSADYRLVSLLLYYHTAKGDKHRLLTVDSMDVKSHINTAPEVAVVSSGTMNTFSIHMQSGEVSQGINEIVHHCVQTFHVKKAPSTIDLPRPKFLRRIPPWLLQFNFITTGFSVEVAGVDDSVGPTTRGVVLQLEEWTAEYQSQKRETGHHVRSAKRRTPSYSATSEENALRLTTPSPSSARKRQMQTSTDGRRLAVHVRNLEGFIIESAGFMEQESFLSMPRFEVALHTSSDLQGPILHLNTVIKHVYLSYSLYRHYALGVALCVLGDAFKKPFETKPVDAPAFVPESLPQPPKAEKFTVDVKIGSMQVKATMPADPPLMLQVYSLAAGSYRWSPPFLRCALVRLHAEAPKMKSVWARIVTMSNIRVGLRHERKNPNGSIIQEQDISIATDFVRIGVPHLMVMHHVFDNFVNVAKAVKQLTHRFKTRTNEYVLEKHAEGPKKVPRISVRSKALLFEIEDDAFEWKLSRIYRLGLLEQKQRLAREEAFNLKLRKLSETRQKQKQRTRSRTQTTGHLAAPGTKLKRHGSERPSLKKSKSTDALPSRPPTPKRSRSDSLVRGRKVRYDPQGAAGFTEETKISEEEAWLRLQVHNARSWKARITGQAHFQNSAINEIRQIFSTADEPPIVIPDEDTVLSIPDRPGLMSAMITDLNLTIDKPSFEIDKYAEFLHKIGKGMPKDMLYTLLVPLSIHLEMGESRVTLRDYPLDLLHIPPLKPGQPSRMPCWSLRTDFVVAEELRDYQSARQVLVNVIPPEGDQPGLNLDVRRTVSPVKMYSDAVFEINTKLPTVISWGMSYQPVIQDMMKIIEGFTKPEIDPSERVGFWDKIRLCFHSRINVLWKGDGDVHLRLKGSSDPYVVTGFGAGFVMCWRKDVQWEVHTTDDPREFMKVTSGEYVLAIPDYSDEARSALGQPNLRETDATVKPAHHVGTSRSMPMFKKVIMKLSGNVRWILGLMYERTNSSEARSFEFKPHYEVILRNPMFLSRDQVNAGYDAYSGFRSNHIHMSVAVVAPVTRVWSLQNREPSASYNTVHFTPKSFTHFFAWWQLFSGVMTLPVRQGPLFPGITKSSKKFGRHLATVKYNLFLSPVFVSHIYRHRNNGEPGDDVIAATGIKARLDSFMLDLHQRREQVKTEGQGRMKQSKSSQMKINKAQLDFINADFRAVSVATSGSPIEDVEQLDSDEAAASFAHAPPPVDLSRFKIPDHDFNWVDMDDFVELDWIMWTENQKPRTQILPLAFSPRFSYYRETDSQEIPPGETGYSLFGDEPTHYCVLSDESDPRKVQADLIRERLEVIDAQIASHNTMIEQQQSRVTKESDAAEGLHKQYDLLLRQGEALQHRRSFLHSWLHRLEAQCKGEYNGSSMTDDSHSSASAKSDYDNLSAPEVAELSGLGDELFSDFNNRFSIHNIQLRWNNALRNIVLRYMHQVSQRRGFVYYMSRRAVNFILDIVEEQNKNKIKHMNSNVPSPNPEMNDSDSDFSVEDRIEQLLGDARRFVEADEKDRRKTKGRPVPPKRATSAGSEKELYDISNDFSAVKSYHVRLIAPQIQLQSDKNTKAVALVTAKGMQLKVVSIMDEKRQTDDINGLVQRRFTCDMDSAQFFIATQKSLLSNIHMYSGNRYGNPPGSVWPPWVPLESMLDFDLDPTGFSRIIQKTSANLRYDKYNTLRLKYNESLASAASDDGNDEEPTASLRHRIDRIQVNFPHLRAICDSTQYYAMYIIVLDLLMYNEPLEKVRNEKLEKIMLASDFSDLRGAPEMVERLQQRVMQIEDLKSMFQISSTILDAQGWKDRVALERDLAQCEDELFFIMKAITTSQRKNEERSLSDAGGILRWGLAAKEIVWHLMTDDKEPLVEFQLGDALYERTDNIDGSNYNLMEVRSIYGLNLLPEALYPEMIARYMEDKKGLNEDDFMLHVEWFMLEAIAGIPVLDNFEVKLFPLKVQLERDMAKKLFEYVFPGIGSNAFEGGTFSPFLVRPMGRLDEEQSDDELGDRSGDTPGSSEQTSIDIPREPRPIEQRLQPTLTLTDADGLPSPSKLTFGQRYRERNNHKENERKEQKDQKLRASEERANHHKFKMPPVKKPSLDSLRFKGWATSDNSVASKSSNEDKKEERKRFPNLTTKASTFMTMKGDNKSQEVSDDLSQMVSRASNYMILTHVKVSDVVLCLSYKGKGGRNIEDVHNFVFRLPVLEYRNKTWSNLDLALRLKKDVIKALISHAPAILSNKFSHHRPTKQQQKRLRELATNSQVLNGSSGNLAPPVDESSIRSPITGHRSSLGSGSIKTQSTSRPTSSGASIPSSRPRTSESTDRQGSLTTLKTTDTRSLPGDNDKPEHSTSPKKGLIRRLTGDIRHSAKEVDNGAAEIGSHLHNPFTSIGRKNTSKTPTQRHFEPRSPPKSPQSPTSKSTDGDVSSQHRSV